MTVRPRRPPRSRLPRSPGRGRASPAISRQDVADYIAAMAGDLQALARHSNLPTLAYLLDMARVEAEIQLEIITTRTDAQDNATRPAESQ